MRKSTETITKRTISIRNKDLLDKLFSYERDAQNTNDSAIFENSVLSRYFGNNELFNNIIIKNINNSSFIKNTLIAICDYYSAMAQEVNDSTLKIVEYIYNMELFNRSIITGKEDIIPSFKNNLNNFIHELEKYNCDHDGNYIRRRIKSPDGKDVYVDEYSLLNLKDTCKYIDTKPEIINSGTDIALVIQNIIMFWNLGENGKTSLKNWRLIWKLLSNICELSKWPEDNKLSYELIMMLKNVEKGNCELYDNNVPALNRIVYLKNKAIITTSDAIVIKEDDKLDESEFENAKRLIHGPNGKEFTDKPIIFLYNNKDGEISGTIARKKAPKDEFVTEVDVYPVPIMTEEKYFDERIKWYIV